ncbi:MAG: hypothetical protein Q4E31_08100 [Intestinibacter bartlettii]|uniref:hypothetical protein n=1 Tax=Intestinibacter bartlettii TaxID=261299 RepID=UPI0026E96B61|nr:hypothetical protein [Intestinibacter bartlettii]MDO5010771.1 hypothetical protein [Intestinibacter bartlettii]
MSNRKKSEQQKMVEKVPIRISVNGIKGKSIITKLITNILMEAGYKVIGKTLEKSESNDELTIIKNAVDLEVEALVCESADVKSDSKKISKFKKLDENIVVITDISEDYVDIDDSIVRSFADIIPYEGYLITINSNYVNYFRKIAGERDTKVTVADTSKITAEYLSIAIAIAVGQVLKIDEKTCLRGMADIDISL